MIRPARSLLIGLSLMTGLLTALPALAEPVSTARATELEHLVRQDCGACHGMSLQGGLGSPLLPDNLASLSDEAMFLTIQDGRPGTPMPPWRGMLSDDDIRWIIHYLRTAKP